MKDDKVYFGGRLAEYKYINIDHAIDRAIQTFNQIENKAKLLDKEAKVEIEAIQAKKEQESAEIQENSW